MSRAFKAFLIAPPIAIAVSLAADLALYQYRMQDEYHGFSFVDFFAKLLIGIPLGSFVSYLLVLLFGVPAYFLLKRLGIVSPWVTILLAALIGALWILLPETFPHNDSSFSFSTQDCQVIVEGIRTECGYRLLRTDALKSAGTGAIGGLAFWLIYAGGWKLPAERDAND